MGIPFDNLDMDQAVARVEQLVADPEPHYVATANVNFVVRAMRDPEFQEVVRMADMITVDGMPLVWASRLFGVPLRERVTGADLVGRLCALAETRGWRVFFLGGRPEVGRAALRRLAERHPGLAAAHHSPPFAELLALDRADEDETARRIRAFRPHILFVSMSAGKGEKWMRMRLRQLGAPVAVGVGAGIDFLAGEVRRAPRRLQRLGLEWLFRCLMEPRRMARRYAGDAAVFFPALLRRWLAYRLARLRARTGNRAATATLGRSPSETSLAVQGRLDALTAPDLARRALPLLRPGAPLALDLSGCTFVDSSGLGALVGLEKQARVQNARLLLLAPSPRVLTTLAAARLEDFFRIHHSGAQAEQALAEEAARPFAERADPDDPDRPEYRLRGRLDVAREPEFAAFLDTLVREHARASVVLLDLSGVPLVDSAAMGALIRAQKRLLAAGGPRLRLVRVTDTVRRVLRVMRLEHFLDVDQEGAGET
jgi:N-acetylglucosaminyldiphosphoundecaprenol N-acetyl-beta-D-mannosaminyltransferase